MSFGTKTTKYFHQNTELTYDKPDQEINNEMITFTYHSEFFVKVLFILLFIVKWKIFVW